MAEQIGKYRIIERIGSGGMGTVYKAHDPVLDRLVGLKVISGEGEITAELKARFYREAQACAKLSHPNIVVVHDLGEDAGRLFIVMELLEGEELKQVIGERRPVPLAQKLQWMRELCDGLHYAHQKGIIHRDVKPGNIFLTRDGQVKILDFGIARIAAGTDPGLTQTGLIMGTLRYMAPEQARGRVDHRADIFSVGAVLYELLGYRPAFDAENPIEILEKIRSENPPPLTEIDPDLPPALSDIAQRALRKDPAQRFADLAEMRTALDAVRRTIGDDAERLHVEVRAALTELRALEAALTRYLGCPLDDATLPMQLEGTEGEDLRRLARELAERLTRVRAQVRRAEGLEPVVVRGLERLRGGDPRGAVAELERVVKELPDHARAQAGLAEARAALPAATRPAPAAPATAPRAPAARPSPASSRVPATRPPTPAPVPAARPAGAGWRGRLPAALGLALVAGLGAYFVYGPAWRAPVPPAPVPAPTPAAPATPTPPPATAAPTPSPTGGPAPSPPTPASSARETAEELRRAADAARMAASKIEAQRLAPAAWAEAAARDKAAHDALARRDFPRAQAAFRESREAFERAADQARQAMVALGREIEARRTQDRTGEARRAAEVAGAGRHAPGLWERAAGLDRDAEQALRGQEFERAQGLWRDAEQAYRTAETEAHQKASTAERERIVALRRDLQAAEQVAALAAAARREAEQAQAGRLAARALTTARDREAEGQVALERKEYGTAQKRLKEAQEEYQRARDEAHRAAEAERQRETERQRAVEAERQRAAEAERQRVAQEAQRTAEAERQRVAAAQRQAGDEAARLKQEIDRVRAGAVSSREQALRIGADRLAREPFEAGRAREAEGASLEGQQQLAAALQAYQDASQRYGAAVSRAQVARPAKLEAEQARARMQAEKQRARADSPDYTAAAAEERLGDTRYESAAFKEAAGHFRSALGLYARAAGAGTVTDARPASGDPRSEIRAALDLYRQAIEEKDVRLFRRVRPGLGIADVEKSFAETRSQKVELAIQAIDVRGDEAEVRGQRQDIVVGKDGQSFRNDAAVVFKLRRRPIGWVIESVN
jgi:hypothetical protein